MTNAPLISRLEEAKEGSRELSNMILLALGWRERGGRARFLTHFAVSPDGAEIPWGDHPDPSRNLQAAVDLVPEGLPWDMESAGIVEMGTDNGPVEGIAATPALALCVAIIKAMEAGDG